MNSCYFFCLDCKAFVPAGDDSAQLELEKSAGLKNGAEVTGANLAALSSFWSTTETKLKQVFKDSKAFLQKHEKHHLRYGEFEFIFTNEDQDWVEWLSEASNDDEHLPRNLIECEGCRSWDSVLANYVEKLEESWWWNDPALRSHAERRFDDLVRARSEGV